MSESTHTTERPTKVTRRWFGAFDITSRDGNLPLRQKDGRLFDLGEVSIQYCKDLPTGLEKFVGRPRSGITEDTLAKIRHLDQSKLNDTDLASVPGPMRWFINTYGPHTPAALIHDWLIPNTDENPNVREEYADRYFRYMLGAVGVPRLKRYIMWTAVAMRTRLKSPKWWRPILLGIWVLASIAGIGAGVAAISAASWGTALPFGLTATQTIAIAAVAPFVCGLLWWKQWAASIVAAVAAPFMLPAATLAAVAYGIYRVLEIVGGAAVDSFRGGIDEDLTGPRPATAWASPDLLRPAPSV